MKAKKLLILGGNPETAALVSVANDMGVHSIVVDPVPNSPAKKVAHEAHEVDGLDVDALEKLAIKLDVDGVLVGVADILVPSYKELCERMGFPCYATDGALSAFSSKDGFVNTCEEFGIDTTPSFSELEAINGLIPEVIYPVLIKPVDNGSGVGQVICFKKSEILPGISYAKSHSKSGRVLIEKYMQCDDMFAYYSFANDGAQLLATADRHKSIKSGSVCLGATYPSKYEEEYKKVTDLKIVKFLNSLKLKNGVLNIQFFVSGSDFFAYDPGFRLQGEGPHIHISHACGFDQRKLLINFSLGNVDNASLGCSECNVKLSYSNAVTVWVLLAPGKITSIQGLTEIIELPSVIDIVQRYNVGETVYEEMIGTEQQVFARIYLQADTRQAVEHDVNKLSDLLRIKNEANQCLILDIFRYE